MPQTVLITSITGFLGAQILDDLVKSPENYTIKATVRNLARGQAAISQYSSKEKNVELVEVPDLIHGDLSQALKGVDAILHVASPYTFNFKDPKTELLDPAIKGTLNVLKQAQQAGVTRVIITSSFAAINNFKQGGIRRDYTYTDADWNPATYEEASAKDVVGAYAYSASKKLAEEAAWDFGKKHSEMKITTLCPPMIYGPSLQAIPSESSINTSSGNIWNLVSGKTKHTPENRLPLFCDARDVSLAHLRALERPESAGHRIPLCGGAFTWEQAVAYIAEERPGLKDRLPQKNPDSQPIETLARIDTRLASEKLGIKHFREWQETLLDTVDDLLSNHARNWQ